VFRQSGRSSGTRGGEAAGPDRETPPPGDGEDLAEGGRDVGHVSLREAGIQRQREEPLRGRFGHRAEAGANPKRCR